MSGSRWTLRCATWNLGGLCMTRTPQSCRMRRRRRSLSLTLLKRHLALRERERCYTSWTTDAEISAKLYCVLGKAASDFNRRQHVPTVVSTEVDESKQVHRDATKDHNCIVAAIVQQVEEVSQRVVDDTRRSRGRLSQTQREAPCPQHPALIDHVGRTRLAMSCGSRDDSLSWNLSRVKQGSAIRADDIDHWIEGRCNVIVSREEGDERNKDRSFHESRVRPRGKEDRGEEVR